MKKIFLTLAFLFSFSARAELVKPNSPEGRMLVHDLAEKISRSFVAETERLAGKPEQSAPDCEATRTSALEALARLEFSTHWNLHDAKKELEKTVCVAAQAEDPASGPAPAPKAKNAATTQDNFFRASLALRAFEATVN